MPGSQKGAQRNNTLPNAKTGPVQHHPAPVEGPRPRDEGNNAQRKHALPEDDRPRDEAIKKGNLLPWTQDG